MLLQFLAWLRGLSLNCQASIILSSSPIHSRATSHILYDSASTTRTKYRHKTTLVVETATNTKSPKLGCCIWLPFPMTSLNWTSIVYRLDYHHILITGNSLHSVRTRHAIWFRSVNIHGAYNIAGRIRRPFRVVANNHSSVKTCSLLLHKLNRTRRWQTRVRSWLIGVYCPILITASWLVELLLQKR